MLVDFVIVGAMKSGTTTLANMLAAHPKVSFCKEKEPHYFSKTAQALAPNNLKKYHALFEQKEGQLYGEASTTYTFSPRFNPAVWQSLYQYNPKLKIIYIVREPIARIISQYMHAYERRYINYDLTEAIGLYAPLLNNGRYYSQIQPYIEQFGKAQVLLLSFTEVIQQNESFIKRISQFLNLPPQALLAMPNTHANKSIGGNGKLSHRASKILQPLFPIARQLPQSWQNRIQQGIRLTNSRSFKQKPQISPALAKEIRRLLYNDIAPIAPYLSHDISHWYNP